MREMKDSGIDWIGEIPADWNVYRNKNGFICNKEIVGEKSSITQLLSLTTKGIKEKDINNAEGKLPESFDTYQIVKKDNMVMCLFDLDVSAVFSGLSAYDGMISPAYRVLSCKATIVPRYAGYWFQYIGFGRKFNHYAKNIRYTLGIDEFMSLPMLFPSIEKQNIIADFLDDKCGKIEKIIEKQEQIIEKLNEYKYSLLNELFADVSGEATTCHVGFLGEMKNGLNFSDTTDGDKIKFLGVGDFKDHFYLDSSDMFSTIQLSEEIDEDYCLKNGDIIFVRSNGSKELVGRAVMVDRIDFPVTYSGFCIRFRNIRQDVLDSRYLLYFFRTPYFRKQLEKYSYGSNISNMNQDLLSQISITFPPMDVQKRSIQRIEKKMRIIDKTIEKRNLIVEKLDLYKKALIYEVITGKKEIF